MIHASLTNILDLLRSAERNRPLLLEALLQVLSLWHVTGFCEPTPCALISRMTQTLALCRASRESVRPSEIKDRWPPTPHAQSPDDQLIKLAIKLAHNLKKSHSFTDLSRSAIWAYPFRTEAEDADHGINTYSTDQQCSVRVTYNRLMSSFKLIRKSAIASQVFDELRLKGDSVADYKTSFCREIVEYHAALELIRNHDESAICQPILSELWSRILLRIQNFFTQFAIYQNLDRAWCGRMARIVGMYCHAVLLIHARYNAILRILDAVPCVQLTALYLATCRPGSASHDPPTGLATPGVLAEIALPETLATAAAKPIPSSPITRRSPRAVLTEPGRDPAPTSVEEDISLLANSLLCMSPVAYARVAKVLARCDSATSLAALLGLVEMWPDGCVPIPSQDVGSTDNEEFKRAAAGVQTGEQWLNQRHGTESGNTVFNTELADARGVAAQETWQALNLRFTPRCVSYDAKWLNFMTSLVGDVCLQYAEGLVLVPDMLVKSHKWIYNPIYLDWVKESREFITMKLTQLQMRSMLRSHSIMLRDSQCRPPPSEQSVERLQEQLSDRLLALESRAEATVQSALDDLRDLSESVLQLLRHLKSRERKSSDAGPTAELTQRELKSESEFSEVSGGGGREAEKLVFAHEAQLSQLKVEVEELREWVSGIYSDVNSRLNALSGAYSGTDPIGDSDKKVSVFGGAGGQVQSGVQQYCLVMARELISLRAVIQEHMETTNLQLCVLQNTVRSLVTSAASQSGRLAGVKEVTPETEAPCRQSSGASDMLENANGADAALDDLHMLMFKSDGNFGAVAPTDAALASDVLPSAASSKCTKTTDGSGPPRSATRSTDDNVSHALLTYIRTTMSAAAAAAASRLRPCSRCRSATDPGGLEFYDQCARGLRAPPPVSEDSSLALPTEQASYRSLDRLEETCCCSSVTRSEADYGGLVAGSLLEGDSASPATRYSYEALAYLPPPRRVAVVKLRDEDIARIREEVVAAVMRVLSDNASAPRPSNLKKKSVRFDRRLEVLRELDSASDERSNEEEFNSWSSSGGTNSCYAVEPLLGGMNDVAANTVQTPRRSQWMRSWRQTCCRGAAPPARHTTHHTLSTKDLARLERRDFKKRIADIVQKNIPETLDWNWA